MTPFLLEVLQRLGLIATFVVILDPLVDLDLTPFERAFFVASGTFEVVGLLFLLAIMVKVILEQDNYSIASELAKKYLNDPLHIYAFSPWEGEEGHDDELETGARFAIILSSAPAVFWWLALTIMVFGAGFVSDGDDHIMVILAAVSFCTFLFVCGVLGSLYIAGIRLPRYLTEGHAVLPYLCLVQKVFGLYLLLSRQGRLASGELGVLLIGFQFERLYSCAKIVVKYYLGRFYECKRARAA